LLSQDLEGVTYSSIRAGLVEFWTECDQFLWQTLVPQYLRPLWIRFLTEAIKAKKGG
jgi:capsid protein